MDTSTRNEGIVKNMDASFLRLEYRRVTRLVSVSFSMTSPQSDTSPDSKIVSGQDKPAPYSPPGVDGWFILYSKKIDLIVQVKKSTGVWSQILVNS